jgi:imidazolonepropionase-like amidohydrolase
MEGTRVTHRPRLTVVRAGSLFDGVSGTLLTDPAVVMDGPTIVAVDRGVEPPPGAEVVDLVGATLLPGLIDTHVHLAFDASADPVAALAGRDDSAVAAAMSAAGRLALRGGVTTVRDLGDRDFLSLGLRGASDLPTIVAAGPPITTPTGHCHFLGGWVLGETIGAITAGCARSQASANPATLTSLFRATPCNRATRARLSTVYAPGLIGLGTERDRFRNGLAVLLHGAGGRLDLSPPSD